MAGFKDGGDAAEVHTGHAMRPHQAIALGHASRRSNSVLTKTAGNTSAFSSICPEKRVSVSAVCFFTDAQHIVEVGGKPLIKLR